jgi:bacillithiol system protein YtxJ
MDPRQITDAADLDTLLEAPVALLFKHSLICPVSARAFGQYRRLLEEGGVGVPSAWLDVIGQRDLSRAVEERTGVRHESPQALVLARGAVRWNASHDAITSAALAQALQLSGSGE